MGFDPESVTQLLSADPDTHQRQDLGLLATPGRDGRGAESGGGEEGGGVTLQSLLLCLPISDLLSPCVAHGEYGREFTARSVDICCVISGVARSFLTSRLKNKKSRNGSR